MHELLQHAWEIDMCVTHGPIHNYKLFNGEINANNVLLCMCVCVCYHC